MALLQQCENGHWIVNVSNGNELWIERRKHQYYPNHKEWPLIRQTGWGTTTGERERETYGQNEREQGREDAVFYEKEDKSLIDVENVETT